MRERDMADRDPGWWQPRALRAVAASTAASGAVMMIAPGFVLDRVARRPERLSRHLFATVGMFMVVSGGTLRRALRPPLPDPSLLGWSAAQKVGASGAVIIAVLRRIMSPVALTIAAFDLGSGLLCLALRRKLRLASGRA
jgi:hypothetical protein